MRPGLKDRLFKSTSLHLGVNHIQQQPCLLLSADMSTPQHHKHSSLPFHYKINPHTPQRNALSPKCSHLLFLGAAMAVLTVVSHQEQGKGFQPPMLSCGGREYKIKCRCLGNLPFKIHFIQWHNLGDRELTYISLATLQTRQDSTNREQNLSTANPSLQKHLRKADLQVSGREFSAPRSKMSEALSASGLAPHLQENKP